MTMPKPSVTLRERQFGEVVDLACLILRRRFTSILTASIPIMIPVAGIIYGLLSLLELEGTPSEVAVFILAAVMARDLVTLPAISMTGTIVFSEKPSIKEGWSRVKNSLLPLLIHWFLWRALLPVGLFLIIKLSAGPINGPLIGAIAATILLLLIESRRWYAPEVFMLEHLRGKRAGKRLKYLGKSPENNHVTESITLFSIKLVNIVVVTVAGITALALFGPDILGDNIASMGFSPLTSPLPWIAVIITWMWQGVAHCLLYLNQRTIGEGWEVETDLRLAALALKQRTQNRGD